MKHDLVRRARQAWLPLAFLALFLWLDWIMHRSAFFVVVIGGAVAAAILYLPEARQYVRDRAGIPPLPPYAAMGLRASPGVLYFLLRGQGTSRAGGTVLVAVAGTLAAVVVYGARIDRRLARFYAVRDRVLNPTARGIAAVVLPVLVGFAVIHGSLRDLPAFVGGTTSVRLSPVGLGMRFFVATVLTTSLTILLLREAER
ncbi:MAG TPA: hypothetical protein VF519_13345 [Mycobacteriales bacterium]|jgi:hypothetical protein